LKGEIRFFRKFFESSALSVLMSASTVSKTRNSSGLTGDPQISDRVRLGRMINVGSLGLFLIFFCNGILPLLPPRPFDPLWQLHFTDTLASNALYALMALVGLHMAAWFDPSDRHLQNRCRSFRGMARYAAIGFLFLLPVQAYGALSAYTTGALKGEVVTPIDRINNLRRAVDSSGSLDDLQANLKALKAPALTESAKSQPFAVLTVTLKDQLDQAEVIAQEHPMPMLRNQAWQLIQSTLRVSVLSVGFATAFAAASIGRSTRRSLRKNFRSMRDGMLGGMFKEQGISSRKRIRIDSSRFPQEL
jgi:hypothetical protein